MSRAFFVRCLPWTQQWAAVVIVGATLALASTAATPERAEAQVSTVQAVPKGAIGLGLLGAELGLIVPAIFGARDWWPYLVFPVLGAGGGAVGGYFMDVEMQRSGTPEVSVAIMAIGIALLVPTIIGTLALTAYSPPTEAQQADEDLEYQEQGEDSVEAVQDDASAAPADDAQSRLEQRVRALYAGGPGLLRFHRGAVLLGVPMVASVPRFTTEELERLSIQQTTDVIVPVVSAQF